MRIAHYGTNWSQLISECFDNSTFIFRCTGDFQLDSTPIEMQYCLAPLENRKQSSLLAIGVIVNPSRGSALQMKMKKINLFFAMLVEYGKCDYNSCCSTPECLNQDSKYVEYMDIITQDMSKTYHMFDTTLVNAFVYLRAIPITGNDKTTHRNFRLQSISTANTRDLLPG